MELEQFTKICTTAEGYLELGLTEEASKIMNQLPAPLRLRREALQIDLVILLKDRKYAQACELIGSTSTTTIHYRRSFCALAQLALTVHQGATVLKNAHARSPEASQLSVGHAAMQTFEAMIANLIATLYSGSKQSCLTSALLHGTNAAGL